jgi:hypothetical protein
MKGDSDVRSRKLYGHQRRGRKQQIKSLVDHFGYRIGNILLLLRNSFARLFCDWGYRSANIQ